MTASMGDRMVKASKSVTAPASALPSVLGEESVQLAIDRARSETAQEAGTYFLGAILMAIEASAKGSKLAVGQSFDDALTYFLADVKAELGDEMAIKGAICLIHNIALFLDPERRDKVMAALDSGT